jgi:hypothetical protein
MDLKKMGLDNLNDGVMTVLAGVTLLDVVVHLLKPAVWFTGWDYFGIAFIAIAVIGVWFANFKHRQQVQLIRESADERTINLLAFWSRYPVLLTCLAVLQAMSLVHRH